MLIESVLAFEVGAAASRIFSSAIWRGADIHTAWLRGPRQHRLLRGGAFRGAYGAKGGAQGHRRACSQGLCCGAVTPWQAELSGGTHSPCTVAGWGASLGREFLQAPVQLPLLPFNTMGTRGTDTKPGPDNALLSQPASWLEENL